jgi:F-type H+-transporting ATPase subunit alpha
VRGYLDRIEVRNINRFEAQLLDRVRAQAPDILESIRTERELSKATEEKLAAFIENFAKNFS